VPLIVHRKRRRLFTAIIPSASSSALVVVVSMRLLLFIPPRTPTQLLSYLLGTWSVSKQYSYVRGGKDGTFAGDADFVRLDGSTVAFEESGVARLGPDDEEFSGRQRLLYTAAADDPCCIRVLFDEANERDSAASIMTGARFFHTIEMTGSSAPPPAFEHPCGPDMYRGTIKLDDEQTFRLLWSVSGPRKLGTVTSVFCRRASESADGPG